jgi:hypothetical protein
MRRDEEDDFVLIVRTLLIAKEGPESGKITEQRKFRNGLGVHIGKEPAEDDRLTVTDAQRGIYFAIRNDRERVVKTSDLRAKVDPDLKSEPIFSLVASRIGKPKRKAEGTFREKA